MSPTSCFAQQSQGPFAWSSIPEQCDETFTREDLSPCEQLDTLPPSPSPARVFSPVSSPSSQSSISDTTSNLHNDPLLRPSRSSLPDRQTLTTPTVQSARSQVAAPTGGDFKHPRRTQARPSWTRPSLIRQDQRRQQLVEQLVDAATQLVALVWPESDATKAFQNRVISLRFFIRETLRRSRTSYSTLQVTLWYLVLIKPHASPELQPESPITPASTPPATGQSQSTPGGGDSSRPLQCGRRMFLSALILASKFLQDRNYTARAWSKITGLPTQEIISNEFLYLTKIGWNLHLKEQDFTYWNNIIIRCTESTQLGRNVRDAWSTVLDCVDKGRNLRETARTLSAQHKLPVTFKGSALPTLERMCNESAGVDHRPCGINFPPHASPLSSTPTTSISSPLLAMVEPKAAVPLIATPCPLATPQSTVSSLNDRGMFADGITIISSQDDSLCNRDSQKTPCPAVGSTCSALYTSQTELEIDAGQALLSTPCETHLSREKSAVRAMRDPTLTILTPSPSVGSDRCDEDGRSHNPSQGFVRTVSSRVSNQIICDRLSRLRSGLRRTVSYNVAAEEGAPAEMSSCGANDVDKHARAIFALPCSPEVSSLSQEERRSAGPGISEGEFYAAIAEKYRKQHPAKHGHGQVRRKRSLGGKHDDRCLKSRCLGPTLTDLEMSTPTPSDFQPYEA